MHPEVNRASAGPCPICNMALVEMDSPMSHQDHSPKHGGIFFMAPDNWHHLEGTLSKDGGFRVYIYDNFSQPMNSKAFEGRAVTEEIWDTETRQVQEITAHPLQPAPGGVYLEATVGASSFPSEVTAKLRLGDNREEYRFDFIFPEYSIDAPIVAASSATNELGLTIPNAVQDLVFEISERNRRIEFLIRRGKFSEIWRPALETKDLALALEVHLTASPPAQRRALHQAMKTIVRSAWQLDTFGDQGDRTKIERAFATFRSAIEAVASHYQID